MEATPQEVELIDMGACHIASTRETGSTWPVCRYNKLSLPDMYRELRYKRVS